MGLIFKVDQPLFLDTVHIYGNDDRAGIDLVGFFLILKLALRFQFAHCHQRKIHQADEFVAASFVNLFPVAEIFLIGFNHGLFVVALTEGHIFQLCGEGRMTAVIRPIGIQHTDFRHGRISVFFVFKVILNVDEILEGHRQSQGIIQLFQLCLSHIRKSIKDFHIRRLLEVCHQSLRLLQTDLTGIHRIDAVVFYRLELLPGDVSLNHIGGCRTDDRSLILFQELNTLNSGICSLVKLPRQKFHGKDFIFRCMRKLFQIEIVHRRLRKHYMACFLKRLVADIFHIITDQDSYIFDR